MLWTSLRKRSPARELIMKNEPKVNSGSFFVYDFCFARRKKSGACPDFFCSMTNRYAIWIGACPDFFVFL